MILLILGLAIALLVQNMFYQPSMGWSPPPDPEESRRTRKKYIELWNGPFKLEIRANDRFSIDVRAQTAAEIRTIMTLLEMQKYESRSSIASIEELIDHRKAYPETPVYSERILPPYQDPEISFCFAEYAPRALYAILPIVQDEKYRAQLGEAIVTYRQSCENVLKKIRKAANHSLGAQFNNDALSRKMLSYIAGSIEDVLAGRER